MKSQESDGASSTDLRPVGAEDVSPLRPYSSAPPAVPDYELLRRIGSGSYGEVWLARDVLGQYRAVKIVCRHSFDQDKPYEREFGGIRKFEPISREHEGHVDILHVGRNDAAGHFYYVMELADPAKPLGSNQYSVISDPSSASEACAPSGTSLNTDPLMTDYFPRTLKHDLRTRGALLVAECIQIALSLTRALEHLHAHGLVHRDIKPSNIIFVKGVPKLADIGLVTSVDATRSFVGTDGYIPPEGPGTPPGDLYSLGKVLYECVTGKDRLDFPELPADWRTRPDFEQLLEVNEILTKACDGDPGQRYASAKGMLADLTILEVGESIKRRRTLQQRWAVCKKAGIAVVLVALATAAALFFVRDRRDGDLLSADPKVNALVEQGNLCILSETPERVSQALKYFKEAIDRDPQSVSAWFGLFQAYISHHGQAPGDWEMNLRATAQHLMEIDPLSTESHFASALIKWIDWQFRAALVEARAATTARAGSKQNLGLAHSLLGHFLLETGNPNEALEQAQLAARLLPATPMILTGLGQPYFVQRRFKEALDQFQKAEALEPRHLLGHRMIAQVYEATGDLMKAIDEYELGLETEHDAEAKRFWEELREAARKGGPKGYYRRQLELRLTGSKSNSYWVAESYAALPNKDEAYKWLDKAVEERRGEIGDQMMISLHWDHNDERFKDIARRVGLMQ